jgi:hypothetical protein
MLTGLRRATGIARKGVLSRRVSKAVEFLSDSKGGEYEAIKRLTKDRGSKVIRVNSRQGLGQEKAAIWVKSSSGIVKGSIF